MFTVEHQSGSISGFVDARRSLSDFGGRFPYRCGSFRAVPSASPAPQAACAEPSFISRNGRCRDRNSAEARTEGAHVSRRRGPELSTRLPYVASPYGRLETDIRAIGDAPLKHKRKKSKRQVRCMICTTYRWMGNTKERRPVRDRRALRAARDAMSHSGQAGVL